MNNPTHIHYPAPADPHNRHHRIQLTRRWALGFGRVHGNLTRRFHATADRNLILVEVHGRYVQVVR